MTNYFSKITALGASLIVVATGGLTKCGASKDADSASRPTQGTHPNKEATLVPTVSLPLVIKGEAMAQAFRSGRLPAPLPQPEGAPEQAAAELARHVIAEDEQSTAALLTALQMSGFSVRADDGSLAFESVKPGQGIVIDAWEVAAMAKLFGDGMQIRLMDLSNALASTQIKDAPVAALLLDGISAAAQGSQTAKRFWADFIVELGRQSEKPYDLLATDLDTGKVDLDAIQVSLILRRLVADLVLVGGNPNAQLTPLRQRGRNSSKWEVGSSHRLESRARLDIRDAVWRPEDGQALLRVQEETGSKPPCAMDETAAKILDSSAYASGKAFDKMLEYMEEHEWGGVENYGKRTAAANCMLAVVKLIASYACMETDVTMTGDPPLVRTQSIYQNGEKRTLTASVRENTGNWQVLNCLRIALNMANLDISLPNDGALADVKTQWILESGSYDLSHGQITYPFVELVFPDGTPLVQNATVPISNASAPKTNEEGHTTIDIEGVKQREKLVNPIPVMKQAKVRFTVAAKPVTMSQDLIDAVGGGIVNGPKEANIGTYGLACTGAVETLLRLNIYSSKALYIPVKDWESCEGGWGGTIRVVSTRNFVENTSTFDGSKTSTENNTRNVEIRLRGDSDGRKSWSGESHGIFSCQSNDKSLDITRHRAIGWMGASTTTNEVTETGVGEGEAVLRISPQGDNKYLLEAPQGLGEVPDVRMEHGTCVGYCPGGNTWPDTNSSGSFSLDFPPVTLEEDPNQPGLLRGSTTVQDYQGIGLTATISWDLTQCQGHP
jgi:hypothetical protein